MNATRHRLRYYASFNPSKSSLHGLPDDTEVVFVPMEAVSETGGIDISMSRPLGSVYSGFTFFASGDVLIAKITPCFENGKGALVPELHRKIGFGSTEFHVLRPGPKLEGRFLHYVTRSTIFRDNGAAEMKGAAGQQRVPEDFVKNFQIWTPPLTVQRAIADFLDRKTAAIDALVDKKERFIRLLTEKRAALIHHAVTKGLNPDAPKMDSGIPLIGAIPAHWDVRKLRYIAARLQGRLIVQPHLYFADEGVPIVFGYNIKEGKILEDGLSKITFEADRQHSHARARAGDLYTIRLGDPGMTAVVPPSLEGCHFASIMWIHKHPRFDSHWLCHCMNSRVVQGQIEAVNYGAAQTQFNISEAVDFVLPFPPRDEQAAIAAHVTKLLEQNSAVRSRVSAQLDRLHEYRKALITAAVTGQLDLGEPSP